MNLSTIKTIVQSALAEDIGKGDITTDYFVPKAACAKAQLIAYQGGIICGVNIAREVFKTLDPKIHFNVLIKDGKPVSAHGVIAKISGPASALLSAERVAINLLSFLSAIATCTRRYVNAVKPYKVDIMDTRKTTPLLRSLERYAVRCGGGVNHRFNLHEMVMIKDNHWVATSRGSMIEKIASFKKRFNIKVEVEADHLRQVEEILHSKADIILLDNMSPKLVKKAVSLRHKLKSPVILEASGGITLENIKKYAATGIERISVGALTHTRRPFDISMEFIS